MQLVSAGITVASIRQEVENMGLGRASSM